MKKFNLNKIGREMPHSQPQEEFFADFSRDLFTKIEKENISPIPVEFLQTDSAPTHKSIYNLRAISIASAAAIAVGSVLLFSHDKPSNTYDIENTIVENVDIYLGALSDEEFNQLLNESSSQRDFYLNLPKF